MIPKYRCFIKSKNQMYKVVSLVDMNDEEGIRVFPYKPIIKGEQTNYLTSEGDVELMQFTGLLDKNQKEIYEGDIVKTYDDKGNIENNGYSSLVLFKNCCFHLYDDYEILRDKSAGWGSVEIIGNQFENPELLNQCA